MNPNPKNCNSFKPVKPEPKVNQQSQTGTRRILNPIHHYPSAISKEEISGLLYLAVKCRGVFPVCVFAFTLLPCSIRTSTMSLRPSLIELCSGVRCTYFTSTWAPYFKRSFVHSRWPCKQCLVNSSQNQGSVRSEPVFLGPKPNQN